VIWRACKGGYGVCGTYEFAADSFIVGEGGAKIDGPLSACALFFLGQIGVRAIQFGFGSNRERLC